MAELSVRFARLAGGSAIVNETGSRRDWVKRSEPQFLYHAAERRNVLPSSLGALEASRAILFTFTVMIVSYTESSTPIERGAFSAT